LPNPAEAALSVSGSGGGGDAPYHLPNDGDGLNSWLLRRSATNEWISFFLGTGGCRNLFKTW